MIAKTSLGACKCEKKIKVLYRFVVNKLKTNFKEKNVKKKDYDFLKQIIWIVTIIRGINFYDFLALVKNTWCGDPNKKQGFAV